MISGREREVKKFDKYVGVGEFQVLGFNLTKDEIKKRCGYEVKTEPVYSRKTPNGVDAMNLTVFLKEVSTGTVHRATWFLENRPKTTDDGKTQYVNVKAMSSYNKNYGTTDNPDFRLPEWFAANENRPAFVGEADFVNFVKNWLHTFDWFNDPDVKLDLKFTGRILAGNFKELNDYALKYGTTHTVGLLTGVKSHDGQEYQDIYLKAAVPGYAVAKLQGISRSITEGEIDQQSYAVRQFLNQVLGKYGYTNWYGDNFKFRVYNSEENKTNTTGVIASGTQTVTNNSSAGISY